MWSNIDLVVSRIGRIHVEDKKALMRNVAQEIADWLTKIASKNYELGNEWIGLDLDEFEHISIPESIRVKLRENDFLFAPCITTGYCGTVSALYYTPGRLVFAIAPVVYPELRFEVFDEEEFDKTEWGQYIYMYAPDD